MSPSIVQLFTIHFKVDLCTLTVVIGEDGNITTSPWVDQKYEGAPMLVNGERVCLYLGYTDNLCEGTGHYDSWVRAPVDKANGEAVASAAIRSKEDMAALVAAQTAPSKPVRKRKPDGPPAPARGENKVQVLRGGSNGKGKGRQKPPSPHLAEGYAADPSDDAAIARDLVSQDTNAANRRAADRSAKDGDLAKEINRKQMAQEEADAEEKSRATRVDADIARKRAAEQEAEAEEKSRTTRNDEGIARKLARKLAATESQSPPPKRPRRQAAKQAKYH